MCIWSLISFRDRTIISYMILSCLKMVCSMILNFQARLSLFWTPAFLPIRRFKNACGLHMLVFDSWSPCSVFLKSVDQITLSVKPQTPLMQAKHWGIFCWAISRPCLSPPAVCLNERAVYRVAFAEPYAGSVEALFNGYTLSTGATETELKRSWHLHCRL